MVVHSNLTGSLTCWEKFVWKVLLTEHEGSDYFFVRKLPHKHNSLGFLGILWHFKENIPPILIITFFLNIFDNQPYFVNISLMKQTISPWLMDSQSFSSTYSQLWLPKWPFRNIFMSVCLCVFDIYQTRLYFLYTWRILCWKPKLYFIAI